jgi:galactokinase
MEALQVTEIFKKKFGDGYRIFQAPGRINLIGEHTDYNLGFVMPGAIDKYIHLAIKPNNNGSYRIFAANVDENVEFTIDQPTTELPGWARYPAGVIKELALLGHEIKGFDAVFGGNIPSGAGLSSSAALESAFGVALNALNNLKMTPFEIAKAGQMAEHNSVGVKCGIMDQFASVFGKKNQLLRLDCRDLSYELLPFNAFGYTLLLADTCVKHSLASSAYNQRREQCEEGARIIAQSFPQVKSLRDVDFSMIDQTREQLDAVVLKRCEYVVEENDRLLKASDALKAGDMDLLGELLYGSHYGLKDKYEVSCTELDFLVEVAQQTPGVLGARMMGGGFGGCTINLIKTDAVADFKSKATDLFNQSFGKEPKFYEVSIANGAREV